MGIKAPPTQLDNFTKPFFCGPQVKLPSIPSCVPPRSSKSAAGGLQGTAGKGRKGLVAAREWERKRGEAREGRGNEEKGGKGR